MARFDRWPCERRPLLDPIIGARIEQLTAYPAHHWHLSAPDTPLTPAGDSLLRGPAPVVITERGSPAQRRLATSSIFRELARDARAVAYTRRS